MSLKEGKNFRVSEAMRGAWCLAFLMRLMMFPSKCLSSCWPACRRWQCRVSRRGMGVRLLLWKR